MMAARLGPPMGEARKLWRGAQDWISAEMKPKVWGKAENRLIR